MADIETVRSLIETGVIKIISYSFEVNIDLEGDPYFFPVIMGDGWAYLPTEKRPGANCIVAVPCEVVRAFDKLPSSWFSFLQFQPSEKRCKQFFDELFNTLEKDGYLVERTRNPREQARFDARAVVKAA